MFLIHYRSKQSFLLPWYLFPKNSQKIHKMKRRVMNPKMMRDSREKLLYKLHK